MGGQKGDRKSYKATSAAKAAEALAAKGGAGGFGGFSGTRPVAGFGFGAPAATSAAGPATASAAVAGAAAATAADPLELSAQLDGELAQCLRHLSKRDTTTKLKALQNLEELIGQKTPAELTVMLQPWAYHFKRLLLDPAKSVRIKAAAVMAAVASAVGKALAPQLKPLLGPWYLASFDPYPDAAAAAKKSLADVFPGRKQLDALIFCRAEVLAHIATCLVSTPASLGDPTKDTPEELEERHERVLTASLSAAAALLTTMQTAAGRAAAGSSGGGAEPAAAAAAGTAAVALQEVQEKVSGMLAAPGFFKQKLGSKSAVVRRAAYSFIQAVSSAAPQLLQPSLATAAPAVMGALQDKEPSNHPAMWEMLLAFVSSQKPDCWAAVNVQKAVVPRLLALLRHGCYGSAATSLPALLPFLAQLPRTAFVLQPLLLLDQVLESVWIGQQQQGAAMRGDRAATAAVAAAYQECLSWALRNAAVLAGSSSSEAAAAAADSSSSSSGNAEAYCRQLLAGGHFGSLLQLAVHSNGPDAQLAADIVQDVLLQQCGAQQPTAAVAAGATASDTLPVQLEVLAEAVGNTIQAALRSSCQQQQQPDEAAAAGTVCLRKQQLLDAVTDSSSRYSAVVALQLARHCCVALLPIVQAGSQLPAPAANLLAKLIRQFPEAAVAPSPAAAAGAAASSGADVAAAAGAAAGAVNGGSSIAALVKLGVSSCAGGDDLAAADAELLLSCVAGSSNPSAAWGMLLDEVLSEGRTVAAWRFLDCLLRQAASSNQLRPAKAAGSEAEQGSANWSHPMLDGYVLHLLQQLEQQQPDAAAGESLPKHGSTDGSSGLSRRAAAAASLLGCCLGANKQQSVLLGPAALESCMETIEASLAAALEQQQQSQQQRIPGSSAGPVIAALSMVLDSSTQVPSTITGSTSSMALADSSRSLWQQQADAMRRVLLLLWQLAWSGPAGEDVAAVLAGVDFEVSSSDSSSSDSSTGDSASASSMSDSSSDDGETAVAARGTQQDAAAANGSSGGRSSAAVAAWQALHTAAGRLWDPEVLAMSLSELPAPSADELVQQLQVLLRSALQAAAGAAAAINAAVAAGTELACRAATVLEGLQGHPEQQQELLQQLLAAVSDWQQWVHPTGSSSGGGAGDIDSSGGTGWVGGLGPVYVLMLQFSSVLVLQAGCDVVMPLHHGHLLPRSSVTADAAGASSSSSAAAGKEDSRLWLRLELLSASSELHLAATGAASDTGGLISCVTAAAAAAERQLVKAAGKGSSGAASAVARSQLAAAFAQLLSAADAVCSSESSSSSRVAVYSQVLQQLLARSVAAVSTSAAARVHLQPVLQQFMQQHVKAAVLRCAQHEDAAAAGVAAAVWSSVLELCAQAFRFAAADDSVLNSSGFAELSVQLMHKATTSLPAAAAASSSAAGACEVPLPLLQLAVACFPIQQQASSGQQEQQQGSRAAVCTAAERKGLAALLRHVCSDVSPQQGSAVEMQLQCQLQLCCVSYCWAEMAAAEWHIVLRDAQQRLTASRREVERAAGSLAGVVCTAAQQLLGGRGASSSAEAMAPAMAIQLLRRLEQKGLLQQQPAVADVLLGASEDAVQQLSQLSVLQPSLEVLASVLQLQAKVQEAGRAPQLGLALAAAWRELLSLLLALGAAVAVVSCCGASCSDVLLQYCQKRGSTWLLLQECLHGCSEAGGEAVGKVLAAANDKAEFLGVDAVASCLALLQQGGFHHHHPHHMQLQAHLLQQQQQQQCGCEPLQQLAWELLLHPASLSGITHAAAAATAGDAEDEGLPEYGVNDDAAAYLVKVGLRPEMAGGLAASRPWQMHMLLWALLLAHVGSLPPRSSGQRRLCQALREVPELVPGVLDRVAGLMGLGGHSSKGSHTAAAAAAAAGEAAGDAPAAAGALSAAAQASLFTSLQAAGTAGSTAAAAVAASLLSGGAGAATSTWNLSVALRSIGLPHSHSSWRLLAAAVYRSVLCTLPASARVWFSDLRDRSRSTAVEAYTSRYESPALLAAEFAAIKRDAAGSSGEVGGSCSFRVVANPANREVTAVLEIEDGATLELVVKLPAAAPLKAPEVDCKNKVGIKDGRLRKWLLSIAVFLRNQNQGVLDGISMWKANLEQEFAGVEACLICYSVISAANGQLPRISCKQCNVKFHPACLYKWLRTSGKSTCPHCQALL